MYSSSVIADWQQIHFFSIDDFAECNIFVGKVPNGMCDMLWVWVRHDCMEKCLEWIFLICSSWSLYKVSLKKDTVFWDVAVGRSSRNLPKCQINLLPPSSASDVEAAGCSQVLLNFPHPKWQHFLQQVFFVSAPWEPQVSLVPSNSTVLIDLSDGYQILGPHMGVENVISLLGCNSVLIHE